MALTIGALQFVKKFFLFIFGILFSAVSMTLILVIYNLVSIVSLLYKHIIIIVAKFKMPTATILKSLDQQMTNCGEMYKATHNYITFTAILEGELSVEKAKEGWMSKLINKRYPNGKLKFPQLQQHIIKFAGFDFWMWDKYFDINNYIFVHDGKDEAINKEKLLEIRTKFQRRLFPKGHGLWEILFVPNYQYNDPSGEGKQYYAFIFKFHHGLADGFSVMKLLWKHLNDNPIDKPKKVGPNNSSFFKSALRYLLLPFSVTKVLYQYPFDFIYNRDRLLDNNHWHTHVEKEKRKYDVWIAEPMSKDSFREIKSAYGTSTMSIVTTIILGGIRRMMLHKNMTLPKNMRVSYPIPLDNHHPDYLVNHATMVEFLAPLASENSTERLLKTHKNIKNAQSGPFPIALRFLTWVAGNLPYKFQKVGADYKLCSLYIPCVPLPHGEGVFFDSRIVEVNSVFYSTQADCGTSVSVLGYNDKFYMALQIESSLLDSSEEVKLLEKYILEDLHSLQKDVKA